MSTCAFCGALVSYALVRHSGGSWPRLVDRATGEKHDCKQWRAFRFNRLEDWGPSLSPIDKTNPIPY